MSLAAAVKAMVQSGCTAEQIAAVVCVYQEEADKKLAERRAKDADRQRKHRERHAVSRDVTVTHVEPQSKIKEIPPTPPKENKTTLPDNPTGYLPHPGLTTPKRGHRLPADWTPPAEIVDFGVSLGLDAAEIRGTLLDEFRDYWCPLTGAKATKLDWGGTYRNRLRQIAQNRKLRAAPRLAFSNSGQPPPAYVSPYAAPKGLTLEEARIEAAKIHARGQAR